MKNNRHLFKQVLESFTDPVFIVHNAALLYANNSFLTFFEVTDINAFRTTYKSVADIFKDPSLIASQDSWSKIQKHNDLILLNKSGDEMPVALSSLMIDDEHFIIITHDQTEHNFHTHELSHISFNDELTSLPNQTKLIKDIDDLESPEHMALAIFNMDSFKEINNFYGHLIGDFVIHNISQRIREFLIGDDMLFYRLPADSFALLIANNIEREYFKAIVLFIINLVGDSPFIYYEENEKLEIDVAMTAGITYGPVNPLSRANIALHEAKSMHANFMVYDETLRQSDEFRSNLQWIRKTQYALHHDRIVPYFQPIVNNSTGNVEKYECLARLIDTDDQAVTPEHFLTIAKRTKVYPSITKIMIKKSFQHFSTLTCEFSINLSIEDIHEHNVLKYIKKMLLLYPVSRQVVFEILETEEIDDYSRVIKFAKEVKALGCKVAIDDFGSGYSNFSHLVNLHFDYLKIDASFIKDIHNNQEKQAVLKTIIAFAKTINTKTIAEFVESKTISEYVTKAGIDFSQGYYFGKPEPLTKSVIDS